MKARLRGGKTIDDVRRFWSENPLFVGEGSSAPGTREWFAEHERIYLDDCLAGEPAAIFSDGLPPDARILDVGCGPGFWVRFFARRGFTSVAACDLTQAAVDLTNRSLDLFRLRATVGLGNAEELPYGNATFEHVNSQGVIHHTPEPRRAIEEFARVLTPGGTVCLSVYYRNWLLRSPWALRMLSGRFGRLVGLQGRGRESMLSSGDADEIVREYDGRDNPIGRAYTEAELRRLFDGLFAVEDVQRWYIPTRALPMRLPMFVHRWLARHFGLMIAIRARKLPAR